MIIGDRRSSILVELYIAYIIYHLMLMSVYHWHIKICWCAVLFYVLTFLEIV